MKSKQEEINQFKRFLKNVEPGGYLDQMFGKMLQYVSYQIAQDFGPDIRDIIQGYEEASHDKVLLERKVADLEEKLKNTNFHYRELDEKKKSLELDVKQAEEDYETLHRKFKNREQEIERLQLTLTEVTEERDKLVQTVDQMNAQENVYAKRQEWFEGELLRLKAKLFDLMDKGETS